MDKFESIKITEIVPSEYNPRKISEEDYEKLSRSMSEFGMVDPIIINMNNMKIIGGHQRYDVLMNEYTGNETDGELFLLRLGDVGWVFPSVDLEITNEAHEKALNVALNKISGEWDTTKLNNLFTDLEFADFDISLTGFDKLDVDEIELDKITFDDVEKKDDDVFYDDFDLEYTINFNNPTDEKLFYDLLDEINEKYDEDTVSGNLLTYIRDKLEEVEDSKYNGSYELIFDNDEEKAMFLDFENQLRKRYDKNDTDILLNLIKEH